MFSLWYCVRICKPYKLSLLEYRFNFYVLLNCYIIVERKSWKIKAFQTVKCFQTFKQLLLPVLEATMNCYAGDYSKCSRNSYACAGGVSNNWWNRSAFLGANRITCLCLEESDKQLIVEIVKMKLSASAIEELKLGTSTQKCEAVNRSLSVSLPKNNDFSRNVHGRLHSTIHRLNNGIAVSAEEKLEQVGVPTVGQVSLCSTTDAARSRVSKETREGPKYHDT